MKAKIAIACQGGGSQAGFTASALQALFEAGLADQFNSTKEAIKVEINGDVYWDGG